MLKAIIYRDDMDIKRKDALMKDKQLYIYAFITIIISVLFLMNVFNFLSLKSLEKELEIYRAQDKELAKVIRYENILDMEAAKRAWISANVEEYGSLQDEGITIEADTIMTSSYTALLDPGDSSFVSIGSRPGTIEPGEALIGLGKYYADNLTRHSGWTSIYRVNRTTHKVAGVTSSVIQNIAYENYVKYLNDGIYDSLGVSKDTVIGFNPITIDTTSIPGTDTWLDVTEYRYQLKNTNVASYLLIKTIVNATTEKVESVDISRPYFESVSGIKGITG
jgi:hypothetical protein